MLRRSLITAPMLAATLPRAPTRRTRSRLRLVVAKLLLLGGQLLVAVVARVGPRPPRRDAHRIGKHEPRMR